MTPNLPGAPFPFRGTPYMEGDDIPHISYGFSWLFAGHRLL